VSNTVFSGNKPQNKATLIVTVNNRPGSICGHLELHYVLFPVTARSGRRPGSRGRRDCGFESHLRYECCPRLFVLCCPI
jgi:hypothetical protein